MPAVKQIPYVEVFTDGACFGNPGPGGWACILRHPNSGKVLEVSGGSPDTTNNRMELEAILQALLALKIPSKVHITTDSQYAANGCNSWIVKWATNQWRRKVKKKWEDIANADQWKRIYALLKTHDVRCEWVRGHSGHAENERCDELARAAAQQSMRDRNE